MQVREGGADGEILAAVQLKATGPDTVKEQLFALRGLTGVHDICLRFSAPAVLQSFRFYENSPYAQINAETFDVGSKEHFSPGDVGLGGIAPGDWMTFQNLDFGRDGSDTIIVSAASPNQPEVQIRENGPDGKLLTSVRLNSSGGWDKAAVTTLDLSGLRGVKDLCFVFPSGSIIFDSFQFTKARASANVDAFFPVEAEDYDDALTSGTSFGFGSYTDENGREQKVVTGLGNNMSLYYKKINFGLTGSSRMAVKGMTPLERCRISLLIGESRTDLEFAGGDGYRTQVLDLSESYTGIQTVTFMFLPGSEFSFDCFTFSKDAVILPVEAAIDGIGDIGQLSEADRPKVEAARKAFDRLDREQQVFVLNQRKLLDAEKKLQLLDFKLSLRDGSSLYLENGILSGLDTGVSVSTVLSQFSEMPGAEIFVRSRDAEVCDPADLAETGFIVCMKVDGIITDQVRIAVYGDADGDARAGVSDLLAVKSFILGRWNPDEAQRAAADVNRDGVINIFDLVTLKMQILKS